MDENESGYRIPFISDTRENYFLEFKEIAYKTQFMKRGIELSHDDLVNQVIYVKNGRLKLFISSYTGHEMLWLYIESNKITLPAIWDLANRAFHYLIIADEDSEILWLKKEDYLNHILKNRKLFDEFLDLVGQRLTLAVSYLVQHDTSRNKVYKFIYHMTRKNGNENKDNSILIKHFPSRSDLASITGVHKTNITKYFTELKLADIIEKNKQDLLVKDLAKLDFLIKMESEKQET